MTRALIVGPDRGLDAVLSANDVEAIRVPTPVTEADLEEAGLEDTSLLFVTDPGEAAAIPVAKRRQPGLRIVWYAPDSVPEFVTRQLDLGVDPSLIEPDVLIEEQLLALGK